MKRAEHPRGHRRKAGRGVQRVNRGAAEMHTFKKKKTYEKKTDKKKEVRAKSINERNRGKKKV